MATMYDLNPMFDSRKSFYGKAQVRDDGRRKTLISYSTEVAFIQAGRAYVRGQYSATTTRHIKDFLHQHGYKIGTISEILAKYGPEADLHPALHRYAGTDQRIKIETAYYDKAGDLVSTWVRCGRVGKTTGEFPAYLIMSRANQRGSSDLIARDTDTVKHRVLAVQNDRGVYETVAGGLIGDGLGHHESSVRATV